MEQSALLSTGQIQIGDLQGLGHEDFHVQQNITTLTSFSKGVDIRGLHIKSPSKGWLTFGMEC